MPDLARTPRAAWTALALSFLVLFMALGVRMSFGAFVRAWEATFGATRAEVSLVSSVSLVVYGFGMPVVGRLADRFGGRPVFAWSSAIMGVGLVGCAFARSLWELVWLYGVVASVGFCGASSVTASVALMKWFPRNRALAVGVSSCGIAAGQMFLAPLSLALIEAYDWRRTLLVYGVVALLLLTSAVWLFFREAPPLAAEHPAPGRAAPDLGGRWTASPLPLGLAVAAPYLVCGFTDLGLFSTHFVPLAQGRGIAAPVVAWALSVDAAANLGGNLLAGYLADRVRVSALLAGMYAWRGLALLLLLRAADPTSILLFAALNGSVEAATIAPTAALCARVYGPGKMGTAFGLVSSAHQFGAAAGAFLIGALFQRAGDYTSGIVLSTALLLVAAALVVSLRPRRGEAATPAAA